MKTSEVIQAWKRILSGRRPSLAIEITRECPLRCPGCYAYEEGHDIATKEACSLGPIFVRYRLGRCCDELSHGIDEIDRSANVWQPVCSCGAQAAPGPCSVRPHAPQP